MHTVLQRLNSVGTFAGTVLTAFAVLVALTGGDAPLMLGCVYPQPPLQACCIRATQQRRYRSTLLRACKRSMVSTGYVVCVVSQPLAQQRSPGMAIAARQRRLALAVWMEHQAGVCINRGRLRH